MCHSHIEFPGPSDPYCTLVVHTIGKDAATRWCVSKDRWKDKKWNLLMTNRFYNGDTNEQKLSAREKRAEGWIKLTMVMREKTRCWWPESN